MSGAFRALSSSIGRKWIIALAGLLLCGFLVVHLIGNLFLYFGPEAYNDYSKSLHENALLLRIAEVGLLGLFLLHIVIAITTSRQNRIARPQRYAIAATKQETPLNRFAARNWMLISGLIVLAFLVLHLVDMRFEARPDIGYENQTPYAKAIAVLQTPLSAILYLLGSVVLAVHLSHGFASAFQTLGVNHPKLSRAILLFGYGFSAVVGVGFASFVLWAMFQ